ncbi:uncharacterized protein LOC105172366 isoform X2 [Sesamum indicum]|uniref:Uncharacterized protein LOC105172366 isoform X2 n=1 Tax=Sesamum indicum TaxID=4182 RepID=A0A6I9TXM5_SESIN|nr:uncharacterized protein LOC105172366 isoform X2 [Sesamum indicum]
MFKNPKGTDSRRVTGGRLIIPRTTRTANTHLLHKYSHGGMILSNRSSRSSICAPTRQCFEPFLSHYDVSCSDHLLISGFWIGPDIEDGWGFVEAFVHLIY